MLPIKPLIDVSRVLRCELSWIPDTTCHCCIVLLKFLRPSHHQSESSIISYCFNCNNVDYSILLVIATAVPEWICRSNKNFICSQVVTLKIEIFWRRLPCISSWHININIHLRCLKRSCYYILPICLRVCYGCIWREPVILVITSISYCVLNRHAIIKFVRSIICCKTVSWSLIFCLTNNTNYKNTRVCAALGIECSRAYLYYLRLSWNIGEWIYSKICLVRIEPIVKLVSLIGISSTSSISLNREQDSCVTIFPKRTCLI